MHIFLSPCGTSLLTNNTENTLRKLLQTTANYQESELTIDQKREIDQHINNRRQLLNNPETNLQTVQRLSAELNGIITYYQGNLPTVQENAGNLYYVLGTDTYQGQQVANLVVEWLKNHGLNAQPEIIQDLATKELSTFRIAMSDLIQWCNATFKPFQEHPNCKVIFNLTGGFKSVNGFLQTIGMFYAVQFSSELLRIPKLPISLNTEDIISQHLDAFRHMAQGHQLPASKCQDIPETLLWKDEDQVSLSEWGELVWLEKKDHYYQQKLLPPLSSKLRYSDQFEKTVNQLPNERRIIINKRLDDFSKCLDSLDSQQQYNPSSLNFKPIKGKPFKDSTHECYGWSDKDAKRIYGHFTPEGQYMIDCLDKHL